MKKVRNVIVAIIVLLIIIIIGKILYNKMQPENMRVKMKAVVVKVNENSMLVTTDTKNTNGLINIGFAKDGNIGYKQGQEILIYYDGFENSSYPGQIWNVGKIEVKKEKSNVEIPERILRYAYSSMNNVFVQISELTNKEITLKITDTNEFKFVFANSYEIKKEEKNLNYTGTGYKIGEDTSNSTAPYIRGRL